MFVLQASTKKYSKRMKAILNKMMAIESQAAIVEIKKANPGQPFTESQVTDFIQKLKVEITIQDIKKMLENQNIQEILPIQKWVNQKSLCDLVNEDISKISQPEGEQDKQNPLKKSGRLQLLKAKIQHNSDLDDDEEKYPESEYSQEEDENE